MTEPHTFTKYAPNCGIDFIRSCLSHVYMKHASTSEKEGEQTSAELYTMSSPTGGKEEGAPGNSSKRNSQLTSPHRANSMAVPFAYPKSISPALFIVI